MKDENKKLGRFDIFSLGVGGAIGSGIFVMLGLGIACTGRSISLAVLIGCLYMLLAYLYHPIMSSMFVLPGGDYDTKTMLMGPTLTGTNAFFTYLSGMAVSAYGLAVVGYVSMIFPSVGKYENIIALVILSLFFLSSVKGAKFVSMLVNIMTVILLASLGLFIIFGLPQVKPGYFTDDGFFLDGGAGFISAIAIMSFACQGTTMGPVSMMKETKNPRKVIPTTIILICIVVGLVYALIGIVASGVLPVEQVAGQDLSLVAKTIFPNWLYVIFILGGAVFAIATSMLGSIQMIRFPAEQVADDGWLPAFFKKRTNDGYPWVVMLLFYVIGAAPIILGFSIDSIISLYMIPAMLLNAYLNGALILMIKKYPKQWEQSIFKMPTPIFYILSIIGVLCAISVAAILFMGLTSSDKIVCFILTGACVGLAMLRLKTGAVSAEFLEERRVGIAQKALEFTNEDE